MQKNSVSLDFEKCAEAASVCACFNLRKASRAVSKFYDGALHSTGLRSTQFVTLLAIHLNEPISPTVLAKEMIADRSTLSRNLNVLLRQRLIQAEAVNGGRCRLYRLSDLGRETLVAGLPLWEKAQKKFVAHMGRDNWRSMLTGLSDAVNAVHSL